MKCTSSVSLLVSLKVAVAGFFLPVHEPDSKTKTIGMTICTTQTTRGMVLIEAMLIIRGNNRS